MLAFTFVYLTHLSMAKEFLYPFLGILQPCIETFFEGGNLNLVQYFNDNFYVIFGLQFAGAALINIIAGLIATNRYLKG